MFTSESSNESSLSAHEVLVGFQLDQKGDNWIVSYDLQSWISYELRDLELK